MGTIKIMAAKVSLVIAFGFALVAVPVVPAAATQAVAVAPLADRAPDAAPPMHQPGFDARPGLAAAPAFPFATTAPELSGYRPPASLLAAAVAVLGEPLMLLAVACGLAFTITAARSRHRRRRW